MSENQWAAIAMIFAILAWHHSYGAPRDPYSCRLFWDAQRQCAFGSCDDRRLQRLRRECIRDGGRP